MFLCGSSNHYLVVDNVFYLYMRLVEQYRDELASRSECQIVTGNVYINAIKTGDKPNWDYHDWGNNGQVTVTWQDYYASAVANSPPANAGLIPDLVIGGGSFGTVSGTMTSDLFLQSDAGVTTIWQLNHQSISKTTFLLFFPKAGLRSGHETRWTRF